ncbi:MAG: hypothetical protein A2827_00185 [Candidatus Spechtbacteria bacterium RIFCSPHIGHO2_01_FULL_43_30]|uniref:Uncharacterized protein n=1 Tax=Candidatus Spechtbacteria bacterium RIFCSPHIGHO2_01_FULL_43_30 TaxID=1802158 RepID=A0A1G2H5R5_9BACT|nr:MAG: hypothetical protein A2827_00185 [Candidatus Spechtbacteria bacterium RIFCSPHIGHO2_01_FULL_43_30]
MSPSKRGRGGRGVWGEFRRARAKIDASPAALLVQSRAKQNILFLFGRIFWWPAQIRNCKEYFAWRRALGSGGGTASIS